MDIDRNVIHRILVDLVDRYSHCTYYYFENFGMDYHDGRIVPILDHSRGLFPCLVMRSRNHLVRVELVWISYILGFYANLLMRRRNVQSGGIGCHRSTHRNSCSRRSFVACCLMMYYLMVEGVPYCYCWQHCKLMSVVVVVYCNYCRYRRLKAILLERHL